MHFETTTNFFFKQKAMHFETTANFFFKQIAFLPSTLIIFYSLSMIFKHLPLSNLDDTIDP
jgi:hypothetical protein